MSKPMTKEQHRAAWIAALRSGDYKQGKGRLRTINKAKKDCLEWSDLFQIKYLDGIRNNQEIK